MSARRSVFQRLPSVRVVVWACVLAQIGIAGLLVSEETWSKQTFGGDRPIKSIETRDVTPGDQSRPFLHVGVPAHQDPRLRVNGPVSLPDDLPSRLEFTVEETEADGRVLLIAGAIERGDAQRFAAYLESLEDPVDLVALHSPGGHVSEAIDIGRAIRAEGLNTLVGPDAACVSSCPYMFAGGDARTASRAAWIGVHQHYYGENSLLPLFVAVQGVQAGQGETMAHLNEMGVDPLLMVHALKTPPEEIYFLVEDELVEYRLATEIIP
ncbi:MAG: hypothetical protein AAFV19_14650 [Pseudomonadota bacterium]